ncbi:hypothetical protein JTE90_004642 [Oedothorax gibbosus]|uniref:DED domain-containing protein n=1 Tax=Oedothorax gibbosus TaxID=931172 RepID=A0AAV6UYU0_9ARAC|nr:hypothetical protein JTE90_004642 [Oedothorax gibbosus]
MADGKSIPKPKNLNMQYESTMFKMFDRVGNSLSKREMRVLELFSGIKIDASLKRNIKNGKDLLLALSKYGYCDESNLSSLISFVKAIKRHDLLHMILMRQKKEVALDPVEEYLKSINQVPQNTEPTAEYPHADRTLRITSASSKNSDSGPSTSNDRVNFPGSEAPPNKRLRRSQRISDQSFGTEDADDVHTSTLGPKKKHTCDVRLRVRAEYCNYQSVLQGNVSSIKRRTWGKVFRSLRAEIGRGKSEWFFFKPVTNFKSFEI